MHEVDLSIERAKHLPDTAYWQMVEATIKLTLQEDRASREHAHGARQLKGEFAAQLASFLGPERLARYQAFRKEQTEQLRAARHDVAPIRRRDPEREALRRKVVERSRAFLIQLGVDLDMLKKLVGDFHRRAADLTRAATGAGEHGDAAEEQATQQARPAQRALSFQPPFHGTSTFVDRFRHAGAAADDLAVPMFTVYSSRFTGEVGSSTRIQMTDTFAYDTAWALCRTAVLSWFQMPTTGQVRVCATLETIDDDYSGSIADQCGGSEIDLRQGRLLYGQVTSPIVGGRVYASCWPPDQYHDIEKSPHDWQFHRSRTGRIYESRPLVVPGVFAAGTWVLVNVGVEQFNFFSSNDCLVITRQTSRFRVRDIVIDSTGS